MNEMWEGALFSPWDSSVSECGGCFCSHPTVVWALWIHDLNKEGTWTGGWIEHGTCWHRKWSGEGPNNQTIAARGTMDWQLAGRSTRQRIDTKMHWKMMAVELGSEHLCCNHTKQFLCLHWYLNFDKCHERHGAELTSNSLATQTIALDVPTQEQVVNKQWIIQISVVLAWRQSW